MAIDSRIALAYQAPKINTPYENRLQQLSIQGKEMEIGQNQRALDQENRLRSIMQDPNFYTSGGGINPKMLPSIGAVAPGRALEFSKAVQSQQKLALDQENARLSQAKTQLELVGRLLGGVRDEGSYQSARAQAQQLGIPMDGVPERFDPAWVQQQLQQTLTYQQQLENQIKREGLGIQRERLDLDRTAPRGQVVDTAQGVMIVDPRSGVARPAVGANSQPVLGERAAQASERDRKRNVEAIEARQAVENSATNLDRLAFEAAAILNDPALEKITGIQGMFPNVPGWGAANVQARLETLKSQAGFAVLQAMRDASKTGGALGNVSNFEVQALQNNLAALDTSQSPEAFQRSLQQIIDYAHGVKQRMNDAYAQQYGGSGASAPRASGAQGGATAASAPTRVTSQEQFNALPSGTVFIAPDGTQRRKP